MIELAQGMRRALKSVTSMTLICKHSGPKAGLASSPDCPITVALSDILASSLPALTDLQVEGRFSGEALSVFGDSCPQLRGLQMEAITVPVTAFDDVGLLCPGLASVTLTSPQGVVYRSHKLNSQRLMNYVDLALRALEPCTSLTTLVLDFDKDAELRHSAKQWRHIPANLSKFVATCKVHDIAHAPGLLRGLRSLSLTRLEKTQDMYKIMGCAPGLREFSLSETNMSEQCLLTPERVLWFQARLSAGLQLRVDWIRFAEPDDPEHDGIAMLAKLPTLEHVRSCTLTYTVKPNVNCLEHVARVFPNLTQLHLRAPMHSIAMGDMDMGVLQPLAKCAHLERLGVLMEVKYTTSRLAALCLSIPKLKDFSYFTGMYEVSARLQRLLRVPGRSVSAAIVWDYTCPPDF
ncbi:MAG: hypothetical protein WDW38_007182 [Sanguina aurantia]